MWTSTPEHLSNPKTKLFSSVFNLTHSQQMSIENFLSSKRTWLQWARRLPSSRVFSVSISFLMFSFLCFSFSFVGLTRHSKVTSVKIGMYKQNIHGSSHRFLCPLRSGRWKRSTKIHMLMQALVHVMCDNLLSDSSFFRHNFFFYVGVSVCLFFEGKFSSNYHFIAQFPLPSQCFDCCKCNVHS